MCEGYFFVWINFLSSFFSRVIEGGGEEVI
jgi:hypothetical protein